MAQDPTIINLPNEILDRIFANLGDDYYCLNISDQDLLNLCKTHRSFKPSAQRLLFRHPRLAAQHVADSTGASALFAEAVNSNSRLGKHVQSVLLDCLLHTYTPWGKLTLNQEHLSLLFTKLTDLEGLSINLMEQHIVGPKQSDVVRDLTNMVQKGKPPRLEIICTVYQLSKINEILGIDVPVTLTIKPDDQEEGYNPNLQAPPTWASDMDLRHVRYMVFEEGNRLLNTELSYIAKAPNLEALQMTLQRPSVEEAIAALETLRPSIKEIILCPHLGCEFLHETWKPTDFSTFSQLTRLYVPSSAWRPSESCNNNHVEPGLTWELEDRSNIVSTLPRTLSVPQVLFKYPYGVFVRQSREMEHFTDMTEAVQVEGCHWVLELLRSRVKRIDLAEIYHEHSGSLRGFDDEGVVVKSVAYIPPKTVANALAAAGVDLNIQLPRLGVETPD